MFLASLAAFGLLAGCASEAEKQWYKPATSYTMAEWERDQKACTTDRVLDEECLRAKGWVPLSSDVAKPLPPLRDSSKGNLRY